VNIVVKDTGRQLLAAFARAAAVLAIGLPASSALAQGGPPMVTDDPETPGNGHWEINLATIGTRSAQRWEVAAPDADLNYGWGEHVQLKVDLPWLFVHQADEHWKSGLGAGNIGVKWRWVDLEDAGFSMSTFPQYGWSWLSSSTRRGITAPGRQFLLPVEAATTAGSYRFDAEVGRNFVSGGSSQTNQWVAGFIVAHACAAGVECMGEVRETEAPHNAQTLLNFGIHWKLNEALSLIAAAGRQFGPRNDDQQRGLFYLGLQVHL
jgi:hypothetical protein